MDTDITIVLTGDDLADHLWQSDEYDLTPEDLTIQFNRGYIAQAREIFKHYPDLSNISFNACISSESFEGKLKGDEILFYRGGYAISAVFNNDWTGTQYHVDITAKVEQL